MSLLAPLDRRLAPPPAERKVAWLKGTTFAHRGLHGTGVPENTMAAFESAIERGLGIELDVQRSSDGHPMVFHDWELDHLTSEQGPFSRRSAEQLGRIAVAGSDQTIPTLGQVLEMVAGRAPVLIEIKSRADQRANALCLPVRRELEGYNGPHAIMSFDPRVTRWFADFSPLTVRGLVITEEDDKALPGRLRRHVALWKAKPDFLAYDIRDLPGRFPASQRARGIPVATWTVRSADHRERAAQYADAPIAEGAGIP